MINEIFGFDYQIIDNKSEFLVKYWLEDNYGNEFLVVFKNDTIGPSMKPILGNSYEMTYYTKDPETLEWSVSYIVNTNVYRLIQTILGDILSDFVETRPWVNKIRLEGLAKKGETDITKRTKLYLRYFTNNPLPGFKIDKISTNRINLVKIIR